MRSAPSPRVPRGGGRMSSISEIPEDAADVAVPAGLVEIEQVFGAGAARHGDLVEDVEEARLGLALAAEDVARIESLPRQGQHVLRDILRGPAGDPCLHGLARHRL